MYYNILWGINLYIFGIISTCDNLVWHLAHFGLSLHSATHREMQKMLGLMLMLMQMQIGTWRL